MDIHIELQDSDAKFSLFAAATYELACGGLSIHMNADQFQQLCDNLRPWIVDGTAPAQAPGGEFRSLLTDSVIERACAIRDPMYDRCSGDTRADMRQDIRKAVEAVIAAAGGGSGHGN